MGEKCEVRGTTWAKAWCRRERTLGGPLDVMHAPCPEGLLGNYRKYCWARTLPRLLMLTLHMTGSSCVFPPSPRSSPTSKMKKGKLRFGRTSTCRRGSTQLLHVCFVCQTRSSPRAALQSQGSVRIGPCPFYSSFDGPAISSNLVAQLPGSNMAGLTTRALQREKIIIFWICTWRRPIRSRFTRISNTFRFPRGQLYSAFRTRSICRAQTTSRHFRVLNQT